MILRRDELFAEIKAQIAASSEDTPIAVVIMHVKGIRELSLRFGYEHGDHARITVEKLVSQALRPVDRIFSIGVDRYALVLPGLQHRNHVLLATARLIQAFEQPLGGAPNPWQGRPWMGIAVYPEHGSTADLLCRRADIALEGAHQRGEQCAFYQLEAPQVEIFYDDLREAIVNNRLDVYFQPLWDLQQPRLVGVESLARWNSPQLGLVSPGDFVPFAEQSDLISALTRWSIHTTLRHAADLGKVPGLTFAINFSPRVFNRPGMVEQLLSALEIWGLPPTSLIIEVTETALANDMDSSVKALERLRDHGIGIAIDDFGTGYASISYLHRLPATEVKIDQSLVLTMLDVPRTAKLVRALIDMAHHLGLSAVAEGIENETTRQMLADMGCDFGQGFHLGRPEPATSFIRRWNSAQA